MPDAVRPRVVDLSVEEFSLLWRAGGFGDPPAALPIVHRGATAAARARLVERADERLAARGLGTVTRPAEFLARSLRLLAEHERAWDTVAVGAETWHGLAVADADSAVLAESVAEAIRFSPIDSTALVDAALRGVPSAQAGPGRAASVAVTGFRRACAAAGGDGFLAGLRGAGLREPEAYTVLRAITGRRSGGQIGTRLRAGGREVLSWVDTADGRYALRVRDGWLTVIPADRGRLASLATELSASSPRPFDR